jgi:hypothetical protein
LALPEKVSLMRSGATYEVTPDAHPLGSCDLVLRRSTMDETPSEGAS